MINYRLDIVKTHPTSFMTLMINTMKEPEIPEIPLLANGRKDSTFAYRFFKSHFWDDCNFTDDRMIRTPVFHNKLKKYFDNILVQNVDTIMREADAMIEKGRPNPEMFKYLIWFITYHYENSDVMGFDKIFVHIVATYYATHQTTWITREINEKIIKKAKSMIQVLIGEKAPNMIMVDTNNQLVSLDAVKAKYLLVLFWDPSCGHCEKEIPVIKEYYDKNKEKYGLEIFAVCSDTSLVKWKSSVRKKNMNWINVDGPRTATGDYHEQYDIRSTPVIYLLDEEKKIVAKRLSADKIGIFLENYIKNSKKISQNRIPAEDIRKLEDFKTLEEIKKLPFKQRVGHLQVGMQVKEVDAILDFLRFLSETDKNRLENWFKKESVTNVSWDNNSLTFDNSSGEPLLKSWSIPN